MPKQNADFLEVLIGQMGECRGINPVFSKTLGVLGHSELFEPVLQFAAWRPPTDFTLSVLDRLDRNLTTHANLLQLLQAGLRVRTGSNSEVASRSREVRFCSNSGAQ